MCTRGECAGHGPEKPARPVIAPASADHGESCEAAGIDEHFRSVSLDGLRHRVDTVPLSLGGVFVEEVLGRTTDSAVMVVRDHRGMAMRDHRNAVGGNQPNGPVVFPRQEQRRAECSFAVL